MAFIGTGTQVSALNAANLGSGTVPLARLGASGTPSTTTFLRGDNTWATPSGGGGGSTNFGDIGTYAVLQMAVASNIGPGTTIAGSSLRHSYTTVTSAGSIAGYAVLYNHFTAHFGNSNYPGGGTALSGTWRKMSTGPTYGSDFEVYGSNFKWAPALYVRIS